VRIGTIAAGGAVSVVAGAGWPLLLALVALLLVLCWVLSKPEYTTRLVRLIKAWRGGR
jgi:hypothetical protein